MENFKQEYWKMKEATNKEEAIISILDVLNHNPLWLNQCTSQLYAVVSNLHTSKKRKQWLDHTPFEQVKELFGEHNCNAPLKTS